MGQQFGLAFDEIGTSQRRNTEVRLTHRWREMDSNYRFRAKTGTLWSPRPFSISLKLPDSPQEGSGFELVWGFSLSNRLTAGANGIRTLGPRKPLTPDCTLRTALAWSPPARATLPASTCAFESALP